MCARHIVPEPGPGDLDAVFIPVLELCVGLAGGPRSISVGPQDVGGVVNPDELGLDEEIGESDERLCILPHQLAHLLLYCVTDDG